MDVLPAARQTTEPTHAISDQKTQITSKALTSLEPEAFAKLLKDHPNPSLTSLIISAIHQGVDLLFTGPRQ
jgi:hypothetical protein